MFLLFFFSSITFGLVILAPTVSAGLATDCSDVETSVVAFTEVSFSSPDENPVIKEGNVISFTSEVNVKRDLMFDIIVGLQVSEVRKETGLNKLLFMEEKNLCQYFNDKLYGWLFRGLFNHEVQDKECLVPKGVIKHEWKHIVTKANARKTKRIVHSGKFIARMSFTDSKTGEKVACLSVNTEAIIPN